MEVSIVGAGPIGLATAAAAVASGALVTIIEPRPARLAAANRLGAARAVSPDRLPPNPVEVVLDTSGSAQAIADAASRLVAGGRLVLVGLGRAPVPDVPPCVLVRGSFAFSVREFARAAHLIDSGLVRLGAMISHSFGLDNTAEAIETAAKEVSALKVVVAPNANG
jgi:threonine dehydrogenase-like Zn-dependent dehydrogenase